MPHIIIMPRQGQSVESCVITEWKKKPGDAVAKGDVLFSYETDKSAFDETSEFDGVMLAVLAEEGEDVECLREVCVIGEPGEVYVPAAKSAEAAEAVSSTVVNETESSAAETAGATPSVDAPPSGRVKISPRAKALALKTNADLAAASPTGPNGRLIERDVNALLDAGKTAPTEALTAFLAGERRVSSDIVPAAAVNAVVPVAAKEPDTGADNEGFSGADDGGFLAFTEEKISGTRRAIAKNMCASLSEMAQLTLNSSFDATELLAYRAKLKTSADALGLPNITVNDMVLYAVSRVLPAHPALNANFTGDTMRHFRHVNLGVAVDTERGLLVPTIFGADTLTLAGIAAASKNLAAAAKTGALSRELMSGGSFTVTNLGSLGVEAFTPVINPPQTAILGVNCAVNRLRDDGGVYKAMGLSLTFDHRAVDGAPAARFLKELCDALANFTLLLAK